MSMKKRGKRKLGTNRGRKRKLKQARKTGDGRKKWSRAEGWAKTLRCENRRMEKKEGDKKKVTWLEQHKEGKKTGQ